MSYCLVAIPPIPRSQHLLSSSQSQSSPSITPIQQNESDDSESGSIVLKEKNKKYGKKCFENIDVETRNMFDVIKVNEKYRCKECRKVIKT